MRIPIAILLLLFCSASLACKGPDYVWENTLNSEKHQVQGPFTIEELEKEHMIHIRETKQILPFGYSNKTWMKLKGLYRDGDKFFYVKYVDGHFFVEHYVLVRGECVIGALHGAIS
jgi:hypothetical protein